MLEGEGAARPWLRRVRKELAQREATGCLRTLRERPAPHGPRDLSSNDYLRLSNHPAVIQGAVDAARRWGGSASASPLLWGYTSLHRELEARLCAWCQFPAGLLWNTGFAANQAVLSTLPRRGDLILADRLIHASMVAGILRSGARLMRYRHLDLGHLEDLLQTHANAYSQVFVVTESVFSMDGDRTDLKALAALKERYGFCWVLDEAHATGWYGQRGSGSVEAAGVAAAVDVLVGTLGKGLGAMGAYTLVRQPELREFWVNFAGELIYSTYLAPAAAGAALAAIGQVEASSQRPHLATQMRTWRQQLQAAGQGLGWEVLAPEEDSPIIPLVTGNASRTMALATALEQHGWLVAAVRPPTVPEGAARLRISAHAELTPALCQELLAALCQVASEHPKENFHD